MLYKEKVPQERLPGNETWGKVRFGHSERLAPKPREENSFVTPSTYIHTNPALWCQFVTISSGWHNAGILNTSKNPEEDIKHTRTLYAYTQKWAKAANNRTTKMLCIFDNMFHRRAADAFDFTWRNRAAMIQCIGTWNPAFGCIFVWRVSRTFSHFGR